MEPARPAPPRAGLCPAGKENRAGTGHGGQLSGSSPPRGRDGDLPGSWPPAGVCGPTGTAPPCSSALALRPSGAKPGLFARPAQVPRPPAPPWPDKDERCLPAGLWGSPPGASLRHYRVVRETGELPPRNPLSGLATFQTARERRHIPPTVLGAAARPAAARHNDRRGPGLCRAPGGRPASRGDALPLRGPQRKTCPLRRSEPRGSSGRASAGLGPDRAWDPDARRAGPALTSPRLRLSLPFAALLLAPASEPCGSL